MLTGDIVFLLDVDNTLLDNGRFGADLGDRLAQALAAIGHLGAMGEKLTTIFVRPGHYALAAGSNSEHPPADRIIERIGDLATFDLGDFEARP